MSAFTDLLVNILLPTFEKLGEAGLVQLLQKFHDNEADLYKASIVSGHAFVKPLLKYVDSTPTKIDDGFVAALDEAISLSAAANGITFED